MVPGSGMRCLLRPSCLLLVLLTARPSEEIKLEPIQGFATNLLLLTEASPAAIRTFNLRSYDYKSVFEYTLDDLLAHGVSPSHDGRNRTLSPAGLVILEGQYSDTIYCMGRSPCTQDPSESLALSG